MTWITAGLIAAGALFGGINTLYAAFASRVREMATLQAIGFGLLDHGVRTATVLADGPTEVLVIGPREFSALLQDVPTLSKKLLQHLAATVRELDTKSYG